MHDEWGCRSSLNELSRGAERLYLSLSPPQLGLYVRYCEVLSEANRHVNLTAVREPSGVMRRLFLDSLTVAAALPGWLRDEALPPPRVVDLGSGAGVPGVPLKILFPHWLLVLVDSVAKKTRFLERLVVELALENVDVENDRAEALGRRGGSRDSADLCTSRAVAALPSLIELAAPLVRVGGILALPKSGDVDGEVASAVDAAKSLKVELRAIVKVPDELGLGGNRATVVYEKIAPTPSGFPRRVGLATSQPILRRPHPV